MSKKNEREGYGILPYKIFYDENLTANDKWVWFVIVSHKNWRTRQCNPSLKTITKECGRTKKTVIQARKKLKLLHYLKWNAKEKGRVVRTSKKTYDGNSAQYSIPLSLFPEEFILKVFRKEWVETGEWKRVWW